MKEDLPLVLLHGELVFAEEFLKLLLFDLRHNVFSFLLKETVQNCEETLPPDNLTFPKIYSIAHIYICTVVNKDVCGLGGGDI